MSGRWMQGAVLGILGVALLSGCASEPEKPLPAPMATDGPNQVVIYVPTMVCESCPEKVTEALTMLSWVDKDSIHADRKVRQVRFTVKDRAAFDVDAMRESIARKGFKGVTLLSGPTG